MKHLKKKGIIAALLIVVAVMALFTGCGKKYELSFETNGGQAIASVKIEKEESYQLPTPAAREGYEFLGWYLNSCFSGEKVTEVSITENTKVYAKWEQLFAVNLNADGGNLSTQKIYLKKDTNVYNAIKDYIPTKQGMEFGAWYNGNSELNKNLKMPASELNLVAKYKAACTIDIYLQNALLNGYDKQDTLTVYEYVGNTVSYEQRIQGFTPVVKDDTVSSLTMAESGNAIKVYYDRQVISLTFNSNYPDGSSNERISVNTYYGVATKIPESTYFEYPGYYLKGWATSANGEIVYESDYLSTVLYGNNSSSEGATITAERTTIYYAVWEKGYIDMFGGDDCIFVSLYEGSQDKGDAYLCRGNRYFKGIYRPNGKTYHFSFEIDADEGLYLNGKLNNDGTFVYLDANRKAYSCVLYAPATGVNEKVVLEFDEANGVTYKDNNVTKGVGTYLINEEGQFVVTYHEGELAGQTMVIFIGRLSNGANAFQIRNEEEAGLELVRFGLNGSQLSYYNSYQIILTGFGYCYYNNGGQTATYYYTKQDDNITLMSSSGDVAGVLRIMEYEGVKGYMFYNENLDRVIKSANGQEVITLDGIYRITYTSGNDSKEGYYVSSTSVFGGVFITAYYGEEVQNYLITTHTEEIFSEENEETSAQITVYNFEEKLPGYAEFYYKDAENIYYAPLFVLDENKEGYASLYGITSTRSYLKVSEGTYTVDEVTGLYIYTVTSLADPLPEVSTALFDIATIKRIVFGIDFYATGYPITYWYSVVFEDDTVQSYDSTYTEHAATTNTLVLVNGMAIYSGGGADIVGTYKVQSGLTVVSTSQGTLYFEVDEETNTFITLEHVPYVSYKYSEDGSRDSSILLRFDGKGNATYSVITKNEDGTSTQTDIVGKNVKTDLIAKFSEGSIYSFESETLNFKFIQLFTSDYNLFAPYSDETNAECSGKSYESEASGILELDGFGYLAQYTKTNGDKLLGYYVQSNGQVSFYCEEGYYYFDVTDNGTFTLRGPEYGGSEKSVYMVSDNQVFRSIYLYFDGYGRAEVFEYDADSEDYRRYIDKNAVYTVDGDVITVTYKDGEDELKLVGKTGTFTYQSYVYLTFDIIREESIVKTYINGSDWTVLILDNVGKATRYDNIGVKEAGSYKLITDTLLYYVNEEGTDACLYKFNADGTIVLCETERRSYYTEDLETLLFTPYGFVIRNGSNDFYYEIKNRNIIIYRYDAQNPDANSYGFVVDTSFGTFEEVKVFENNELFGDKTYYRTDGYAIEFTRQEANLEKYPVNGTKFTAISFYPYGTDDYTVEATLTLVDSEGKKTSVSGYVSKDEDGLHVLYMYNGGYYLFDTEITYKGAKESSFVINSMYHVTTYLTYQGAQFFMLISMFYGSSQAQLYYEMLDKIGVVKEYDEDGNVVKQYVESLLNPGHALVDTLGNEFSMTEDDEYTLEGSLYTVKKVMPDGYEYAFRFTTGFYGSTPYFLLSGFNRIEVLDTEDGYTVSVERILASDRYEYGNIYSVVISYNGEKIEATETWIMNGIVYQIARQLDEDNKVVSSVYYVVTLHIKDDGLAEEVSRVPVYDSASIEVLNGSIYYTEDGKKFVEVSGGKLLAMVNQYVSSSGSVSYSTTLFKESVQNEDGSYTATTANGKVYNVVITDGVATITEVIEEAQE